MEFLTLLQSGFALGSLIKNILDVAQTNEDVVSKIKALSGPFASILEFIGKQFFPQVREGFHMAAAATAAFDPNITKFVQGFMNGYLTPSPSLVVDGVYGPRTKAAVTQLQQKLGLTVDGWAGQVTQAAIMKLVNIK